jgi:hypothetical protein
VPDRQQDYGHGDLGYSDARTECVSGSALAPFNEKFSNTGTAGMVAAVG